MSSAIAGAGSIGVAFAVTFAIGGREVSLWDPDPARLAAVPAEVAARLAALARHGLLDEAAEQVAARVHTHTDLAEAVADAELVQECAPERAELKQGLFAQLLAAAPAQAIIASSSSAIPISQVTAGLSGRERCLVAHPGNPPYLLPVIELVGAEFTDSHTVQQAAGFYRSVGMNPVVVHKEVEGFVFNRLQGALLREAYCLVRDGVISVEDLDTVVRDGPGRRWAFIGPFETVDLNTRGGIASHAQKMGPAYRRMGNERGQDDPWTDELVASVAQQRAALLDPADWEDRVLWRDEQLMRLAKLRRDNN